MIRQIMALLGIMMLGGCITPYPDLTQSRSPCRSDPGGWCDFVREAATDSYGYAMLSSNAYQDDDTYTQLPPQFEPVAQQSETDSGLAYSVFNRYEVSGAGGKTLKARVIVFRGTDFGSYADIFKGSFGDSQIELARKVLAVESANLALANDDNAVIELAGHSLGGALATQLSIENNGLRAFVFNTSPFFSGDPMVNDSNRLAISERGEFLRLLRRYKAPPAADMLVINCNPSASAAAKHSIRALADCLTWIAAYDDPDALAVLAPNSIAKPETECGPADKRHPGAMAQAVPCVHAPNPQSKTP